MTESLLPPGLKIRVLTTIEDGEVTQEALPDNRLVATVPDFITAAHHAGLIVSRKLFKREWADALSQASDARELLCKWSESITDKAETIAIWEIIELVSEAISSLKKINIGE